jgi:hypothetical protein
MAQDKPTYKLPEKNLEEDIFITDDAQKDVKKLD